MIIVFWELGWKILVLKTQGRLRHGFKLQTCDWNKSPMQQLEGGHVATMILWVRDMLPKDQRKDLVGFQHDHVAETESWMNSFLLCISSS